MHNSNQEGGCPRSVMVKAIDYEIVVSEFELQSRYYVHFRTNTLDKGMNPLILPAMVEKKHNRNEFEWFRCFVLRRINLFGSFIAELSNFNKSFKLFNLV